MTRKKTAATRLNHPHSSIPRQPPERDAFVDQFLSTVCDTSRRSILELLAGPNDKDPSVLYERRSGEIAEALGLSSATTSETRTGRWALAKHPGGQEPQARVAGHDGCHQPHQKEALPDLRQERSLHRVLLLLLFSPVRAAAGPVPAPSYGPGSSAPAV